VQNSYYRKNELDKKQLKVLIDIKDVTNVFNYGYMVTLEIQLFKILVKFFLIDWIILNY